MSSGNGSGSGTAGRNAATMDPPHMTEFASQRYFDKVRQLDDSQTHDNHHVHHEANQSTFTLPIGRPRSPDSVSHHHDAAVKRRTNFSLRSILPSRSSTEHDSRRLSTDGHRFKSASLDHLFLSLPNELKIQVIASLPLSDVLHLRLASRSWHAIISVNEFPIARYHLDNHVPHYAKRLYPAPDPSAVRLHHLCGIWHRLHVAAKMSYLICERTTKEIFLRDTESKRREFEPQHERMRRRLIPLIFTLFHFFEKTRELRLQHIREHGHGLSREAYTFNPIEREVMSYYDDETLLRVHQVFPLVMSSFTRRLRPPSYAGRLERSIRGYLRDAPSDDVYVASVCVGGLRQVERFWEIKGYNSRRTAVDSWYNSLTKPLEEAPAAKHHRRFMGLSRKKSIAGGAEFKSNQDHIVLQGRPRRESDGAQRLGAPAATGASGNLVFETSLAAGMPMEPLSHENLRLLMSDLPSLRDLWAPTAEALILERKIVERPQDIKRNAQVLLDLIGEAGGAVQDEWRYGRTAPESVRPPLEAIEEDPIE